MLGEVVSIFVRIEINLERFHNRGWVDQHYLLDLLVDGLVIVDRGVVAKANVVVDVD